MAVASPSRSVCSRSSDPERVRDTPLSESAFVGAGIGAAMGGLRPIVEIMTVNFSLLALDQIMNNAATLLHMSGGQFNVPLVIRMTTGAGRQLAAQHSHSLEGWYAHIPGLRVLAPATVHDARHMLDAGARRPRSGAHLRTQRALQHDGRRGTGTGSSLEGAACAASGGDVSIITYGGTLPKVLDAAAELGRRGNQAEVIDLRSLRPLDDATILASVARGPTGCWSSTRAGAAAASPRRSVPASPSTRSTSSTRPVQRICSAEVPMPYAQHLEQAALPQVPGIVSAAQDLVSHHV